MAESKFDLAEIERLRRGTNMSTRAIAAKTGASETYVRQLIKERGWPKGDLTDAVAAASIEKAGGIEILPPGVTVPALLPADQIVDELSERGKMVLAEQAAAGGAGVSAALQLFNMASRYLAAFEQGSVNGVKVGPAQQMALATKAAELCRQASDILAKSAPVQLRAAGLPERVPHAAEAAAAAKAQAGVNLTINNGSVIGLKPIAEMTDDELLAELQAA